MSPPASQFNRHNAVISVIGITNSYWSTITLRSHNWGAITTTIPVAAGYCCYGQALLGCIAMGRHAWVIAKVAGQLPPLIIRQ